MSDVKIYITDCDHDNINEETAVFTEAGIDFELVQCHTEEDLINTLQDATAVCNQYAPFTEKVFAALPKLKTVVRYGVGVDNVDLKAASAHGVTVCNVPDYGTNEVADHGIALLLELVRKVGQANNDVQAGIWDYARYIPVRRMSTLTVGIIGLGRIGSAFAKRAHAFGCKVIAYDIDYTHAKADSELSFVELKDSMDEVLASSDVISLHCSLNESNAHFMNAQNFAKMKQGSFFVNVSRGGLVNEADLAHAVKSGHLSAAGIDVTCTEPLDANSPLRACKNIVITPHMAWYAVEAASDLKTKCAQEAVRGAKGEPLRCPVNKI